MRGLSTGRLRGVWGLGVLPGAGGVRGLGRGRHRRLEDHAVEDNRAGQVRWALVGLQLAPAGRVRGVDVELERGSDGDVVGRRDGITAVRSVTLRCHSQHGRNAELM